VADSHQHELLSSTCIILYIDGRKVPLRMNKHLTTGIMIIVIALGTATMPLLIAQLMPQLSNGTIAVQGPQRKVSVAGSGDNIYIAWVSNKTGNDEIVFRSSNDAGATFNDKITLSNTTDAELQDVQIAIAAEENVLVTWWQVNSTSEEPVARISTDNGQTFEPLLNLAANGTITLIG
jgi:hypothetical protein